jgi:hypothetical protein
MGSICNISDRGKGCELLIDTGTYLTYIPRKMFYVYLFILNFNREFYFKLLILNN